MTRLRLASSAVVVALLAAVCASSSPAVGFTPMSCPLGSDNLHRAVSQTLAGLDRADFLAFDVGSPPRVAVSKYSGPLWATGILAGSSDPLTFSVERAWEASLATGAIATRCSAGHIDLYRVMAGSQFSFAAGQDGDAAAGGQGNADARLVVGAQARGEADSTIIERARRVLAAYDLTPVRIRVLHPLGPALDIVASVSHVEAIEGRMDELETALGNWRRPEFDGLYLALLGPDGTPLYQGEVAARAGEGGFWEASGFDSGIMHG